MGPWTLLAEALSRSLERGSSQMRMHVPTAELAQQAWRAWQVRHPPAMLCAPQHDAQHVCTGCCSTHAHAPTGSPCLAVAPCCTAGPLKRGPMKHDVQG